MNEWVNALGEAWREPVSCRLTDEESDQIQVLWEGAQHSPPIFPPACDVFAAFASPGPESVRVVILGQDPYHGVGQAHGLAFSVRHGVPHPPSLRNLLQELASELPADRFIEPPVGSGVLSGWSEQGVLLLNAALTVREGEAGAHRGKGWEALVRAVLESVSSASQPVVYLLWGNQAGAFAGRVHRSNHLVIKAPHPSPLSAYRGFFGSRPFSRANAWLVQHGVTPVDWWRGIPNR